MADAQPNDAATQPETAASAAAKSLRIMRECRGLTQEALAVAAGVSSMTITRVECQGGQLQRRNAVKVLKALQRVMPVSIEECRGFLDAAGIDEGVLRSPCGEQVTESDGERLDFGALVASMREMRGLSQVRLAELANVSGFTIRRGESGGECVWKNSTAADVLRALHAACPVHPDEMREYCDAAGLEPGIADALGATAEGRQSGFDVAGVVTRGAAMLESWMAEGRILQAALDSSAEAFERARQGLRLDLAQAGISVALYRRALVAEGAAAGVDRVAAAYAAPTAPRPPRSDEQTNDDGDVVSLSPIGEHILAGFPAIVTSKRGYVAGLRHWMQNHDVARDQAASEKGEG